MDLHVKKFQVRYQGNNYGPGSVIYDVPNGVGEKLIAESNGTIEAMPKRDDDIKIVNTIKSVNDSDNLEDVDVDAGLPSLDPKKTVK